MESAMRITSKGQVTIPAAIREKAGLMPNTEVEFVWDGATVRLEKSKRTRGKARKPKEWLRKLRGSATVKLSTDEIMRMTRDW
jgi:AbrB family looped-hinge helix DNA binding protein